MFADWKYLKVCRFGLPHDPELRTVEFRNRCLCRIVEK